MVNRQPTVRARAWHRFGCLASLALLIVGSGCGAGGDDNPSPVRTIEPTASSPAVPPSASASNPSSPTTARVSSGPTTRVASPTATRSTSKPAPAPPGLVGDRRNVLAFARLDDPGEITVEGRVSRTPAWSTSKVLVVAAYLETAAGGNPDRVSGQNRRLITAALTESDADAVVAIRRQIRGRPGPAMTAVLRDIGDKTTVAPDSFQGQMSWTAREQVRFMAALGNGKVVSRAASTYLLASMRPIRAHAWGLGTIGASAYKGGWLRPDTVTRQMGLVDGYAVVIITDGVGPAVRQSDGDSAHVQQMNRLAALVEKRLAYEKSHR